MTDNNSSNKSTNSETSLISDIIKSDDTKSNKDGNHHDRSKRGGRYNNRSRNWKRGKHGNRNDSSRGSDDYSHLEYDKAKPKSQKLDLEIFAGSDIRANGLYPISGKSLPKKDISIDWYKEVPATANGALTNMATAFSQTDINLGSLEADTLDYINVQLTHMTYAQLPFPGWIQTNQQPNNLNPIQPWPGYGTDNYTSFTTMRSVELAKQLNIILVSMQTNEAFATMAALNYYICPFAPGYANGSSVDGLLDGAREYVQDRNPFWGEHRSNGLLGFTDSVNTAMLMAVCTLYNIKRTKVILEYMMKRHYTLAPYIKLAYGLMNAVKFKAIVDAFRKELSYIFCDTDWVEREAKALMAISKSTDSVWSPLIIPTAYIEYPQYSLVSDNGNGFWFTLAYGNGAVDGGHQPFFMNHAGYMIDNLAITLLDALQAELLDEGNNYNGAELNNIARNWFNHTVIPYVNNALYNAQRLKTQCTGYNALMAQAVKTGLIFYKRKEWEWDIDIEIKYVPQLAIPLQHPETVITGVPNIAGQYPANIALEGTKIENALVDSTRQYAIAGEWLFNLQLNNFDNDMPQFMHVLSYQNLNVSHNDGVVDCEQAAVAPNGTVDGVFQLPEIVIYGWLTVYTLNGGSLRFRHWKNYGLPLQASNVYNHDDDDTYFYENLTWRGAWALSDGIFLFPNDDNVYIRQSFYTNYGMSQNPDALLVPNYWTSSFTNLVEELGVMTTNSSNNYPDGDVPEQNYVNELQVRSNYVVSMPVTMRNANIDMILSTIDHSLLVSPVDTTDVAKMVQVPTK